MTKVSLDAFKREWEEQIAKIENRELDDDAVRMIRLNFDLNKIQFKMFLKEEEIEDDDAYLKLDLLESKLEVALETANCRFKLQNRGVWARAVNGFFEKMGRK